MCKSKSLQKKMIQLFEEKVGQIPETFTENKALFPIPLADREVFKKVLQAEFPDLRYRNINGLVTIDDFAVKIEAEVKYKEDFFKRALNIIRETTKHPEYGFQNELLAELKPKHTGNKRLSEEANYFLQCKKVYDALSAKVYTTWTFRPSIAALEKAQTLEELIDIYYRKGRF